ncbi:glpV [Symbiodinium sp. KB8]|nr:glpV [Symbiodinium sp. KB8]
MVGSHTVNGVAAIHSELIKTSVFPNFYDLWPEKFQNKTNGITPRRWLNQANQGLSALISELLGTDEWLKDLDMLRGLQKHASDPTVQEQWMDIKYQNKKRLAHLVKVRLGLDVDPNALFDVQVKRIHEYKRQLMNCLFVIYRYHQLKRMSPTEREKEVPRVVFFGGKAASGYRMAKRIIKLIHRVSYKVNADKTTNRWLKLVFIPNYNVSNAEIIIPASDLSQHISTAGMEASGTSNMKFALNGGLIIGTMDGANIEIADEIGKENM